MAIAGVINTGTSPRLLWPGIADTWGQVYDEHPQEWHDLYDEMDSEKAYELDYGGTGFGLAPVKPQGDSLAYDSEVWGAETYYRHIAYALGFIVTYEEIQDNLYKEVATRRMGANAFSMVQTVENVAALLYNNAFNTTYFSTWDGLALGSASHINLTGGTYSNILSPAADLSEAALEAACIQIMGYQNDRGLLISVMPESLHIPRQEWFNANRILKSVLQPNTTSNNINVLKATNAFPKGIKMNHYFTGSKRWFIRTRLPNNTGMKMYWRDRPSPDQDNDFDTKNLKHSSYMRFSVGCTDPRSLFAVNAS